MTMQTLRIACRIARIVGLTGCVVAAAWESAWGRTAAGLVGLAFIVSFLCDAFDDLPGERVPHERVL